MRIAFFGTPQFSAEILKKLLKIDDLDIALVVSQTDKPIGRKKIIMPTPVKEVALDNNIEVLQPTKLAGNTEFFDKLNSLDLDFIVVVAYGKIVPTGVLTANKYGPINIHGSILPKYRGASPVQECLLKGDKKTGLTIMFMDEKMDEGDILAIKEVDIDIVDTQKEIFEKFVEIGPDLLVDTLKKVSTGELKGQKQNYEEATYCSMIKKQDGQIDFNLSSEEIYNKLRAYTPWPGIFTQYKGKKFAIEKAFFCENQPDNAEVGDVIKTVSGEIGIVCGKGVLTLKQVKVEGKKSQDIKSFLNGHKDFLDYNFNK
ncbi:MAG: methionyl-tRNA formyltransferase [Candidatus Gracilibacteria bacterium]|nr:methionyl-tRNA formyltransferase [Candidatus Gracilibacteria bacterium]